MQEETALQWLKRTNLNRKRAIRNPIHYPCLSSSIDEAADISVEPSDVSQLAAETFFHRNGRYQKIQARMKRWRLLRDKNQGIESKSSDELDELVLNCFPHGTGISFLDKILENQRDRTKQGNNQKSEDSRIIELIGKSGTCKSRILMNLAANFIAATSTLFLSSDESLDGIKRDNNLSCDLNHSMPQVIIIDPEFGVHINILENLVRAALIRRWNITEDLRKCLLKESTQKKCSNLHIKDERADLLLFERELSSTLQRVHFYHPKDVAGEYVATLECIYQSLNQRKEKFLDNTKKNGPMTLLLMDSAISAFEHIDNMYDSLPSGQGLSGRIEFIRQLDHLISEHDVFVVATRHSRGKNIGGPSSCESWNKIVTDRLQVERVIPGTKEHRNGFHFVALTSEKRKPSDSNWNSLIPFSITADGMV